MLLLLDYYYVLVFCSSFLLCVYFVVHVVAWLGLERVGMHVRCVPVDILADFDNLG